MDSVKYNMAIEFEKEIVKILYRTSPLRISHYNGGRDRGRDIVLEYNINDKIYHVIVECKFHKKSINKEKIMSSLNWAKVHKPDMLYIWAYPFLTPDCKDYIAEFEKAYSIDILYEEKVNIDEYIYNLDKDNKKIFDILQDKILLKLTQKNYKSEYTLLNYASHILSEDCFLVDRQLERKILLSKEKKAFYLQGVPFSGKSQLMKRIVKESAKEYEILWFQLEDLENEQQNELFLRILTTFILKKYNNNILKKYFSEYGYHININLISLICDILIKYNVLIVLDDVHKCKYDNIQFKKLLENIIINKVCKIYLIGWFYIFDNKIVLDRYMKDIILSGLNEPDLNKIIKKNTGKLMNNVANKIHEDYNGLPGFANLISDEFLYENLKDENTFFYSFYNSLEDNETAILQSLTISTFQIPIKVFIKLNLIKEIRILENKRIIENHGEEVRLHDRYKLSLKQNIYNDLNLKVFEILTVAKDFNLMYLKDLINLHIQFKNFIKAFELVDTYFYYLIKKEAPSNILDILNNMIRNIEYKKTNLFIKKIILLERLEQYELCMNHIELIKNKIEKSTLYFEEVFYNELRCLYFTNNYDDMLSKFIENYHYISSFSSKYLIQVQIIIARIFFVKGDFNLALKIFLNTFKTAHTNFEIELALKTLHKILQIEIELKLYKEAYYTFDKLLNYDSILSIKRKSYIYHRMAVCQYKLHNLELAEELVKKSLDLKRSINLKRGYIFSYKILSLINLKKNNILRAKNYIKKAIDYSLEEKLYKEALNCGIIELEVLINDNQKDLARTNLVLLYNYAKNNNFLKSINKLLNITSQFNLDNELLDEMESYFQQKHYICDKQKYIKIEDIANKNLSNIDRKYYNKLIINKQSISKLLLEQLDF